MKTLTIQTTEQGRHDITDLVQSVVTTARMQEGIVVLITLSNDAPLQIGNEEVISLSLIIHDGEIALGHGQRVFLQEYDAQPRTRTIHMQIVSAD